MSIPGFTAEASVYTSGEVYQGEGTRVPGTRQAGVVPQCCELVCGIFNGKYRCHLYCHPGLCQ